MQLQLDPADPFSHPPVKVDKTDYQPGETAQIAGSGFAPYEGVTLQVTHINGVAEAGRGHEPWTVYADAQGGIWTTWYVDPLDSLGAVFQLTVSSSSAGTYTAEIFTDGTRTVTLHPFHTGWYRPFNAPGNSNYLVGALGGSIYRNFFVFNVPPIQGNVSTAALVADNTCWSGRSATYSLYDVTTPINDLNAGGTRPDIATDLGSGVRYGSTFVDNITVSAVTVNFAAEGLSAIHQASGKQFAIGGDYGGYARYPGFDSFILGCTDSSSTVSLIITTTDTLPTSLSLAAASGTYGGSVQLSATLTSNGSPVTGRTLSFAISGAAAGDATTDANGVATFSARPGRLGVGTYPTSVSFGDASDYLASRADSALTIEKAKATISVSGAGTVTYDGLAHPATGSVTGAPGENLGAAVITYTDLGTGTSSSAAPVNAGSYTVNASFDGNANYFSSTNSSATIMITKASLTITAENKTKLYGAALPSLTVMYDGFVNGETPSNLATLPSITTDAAAGSHVGDYSITPTGAVAANYAIKYVNGTLKITPAGLTITADDKTRLYGAALPALTASYAGFVNGDTPASLTTLRPLTTSAPATSPAGTYPITAGQAVSADYTITYNAGTLSIAKAPLTMSAAAATKPVGAPNPAFSATYSGFVLGQGPEVLMSVTFSTPATDSSPVGVYPITPGASSPNYEIKFVNGSLSISYGICLLYNPAKPVKSGATIPIQVQLCGATGNNQSSPSVVFNAQALTLVSPHNSADPEDAGNANPDQNFRFTGTQGGGYIFNLKTNGLVQGTYNLRFSVTDDPATHDVQFQVR